MYLYSVSVQSPKKQELGISEVSGSRMCNAKISMHRVLKKSSFIREGKMQISELDYAISHIALNALGFFYNAYIRELYKFVDGRICLPGSSL